LDSGQLGEQVGGSGERLGGCGAGHHAAQTRRQGRVGDAKIVVAGHDPTPAGSAVVVGTAQRHTPQHGIDVLVAVTDELREMPGLAVDPRPAMSGVGGQQLPQQHGTKWVIAVRMANSTAPSPAPDGPSASTASAASRSTSAAISAAIWS
jgi:hypothetical protein